MDKSRSYLAHDKHQVLDDALLDSMILDDAVASGQADPKKVLRKRDRDDEDRSAGPNQGRPDHLTIAAEYFFNNDLEFLKSSDIEKKYTTSIMKTKAACVSVKKLHVYGHLEEITMRRVDLQVYKFKECDLVDLHLKDIKDMLLLAIKHKLFQLDESDIVNLIVAFCMFTRSLIIKRRVEDLQLGVES
nr:hypothetical protein [Tanacetum cinerariifolium]